MTEAPTSSRRNLALGAIFGVAVLVALGAFALRTTGGDGRMLLGGTTYTEGVAGTWHRVNPLFATTNEVDEDLAQLVFSGLTRLGPDGQVLPDLATAWEITDAGRTYTFQLRRNVKWHDGQPFTSRDVVFTIETVSHPDFKGDPGVAESWLGVEVEDPDDHTVVFRLPQANSPFLTRNTTLGVLPQHLLRSLSPSELFESSFNAAPIGTGPYRLDSLESRHAVFSANSSYYLGAPSISTVRIQFFPDYPSAIRAMDAGELDGLLIRDTVGPAQVAELEKMKGTSLLRPQRDAHLVLYLNNDQAAFFQDERVRHAISLALDRRAIIDEVFAGIGRPSSSPIPPNTWAYADQYDVVEERRERARQLLTEAGWVPLPGTGILAKQGAEFRFTIRTDNDPARVAVAGEIAKQLETIGIRATVASTTFAVLRRDFLQERKYDAAIAGWDQGADPDPYFGWHSSQMGTAALNLANFQDIVVDSLIAQGRSSDDIEVRRDAYRQFQEVWQDLTPSVILAYPEYTYLQTQALKGATFGVLFTAAQRFADIHTWKR
jgi:peptide/nickel transport system substrate-binding protein